MENFGKDKLSQMRETFHEIDRTGTGELTIHELELFMKPLDKNLDQAVVKNILKEVMPKIDKSGDGKLDFTEFAILMADTVKDEHQEEEIKLAYESKVKKTSNNITKDKMKKIFKEIGETDVTQEELDGLYTFFNIYGNEMSYNDFRRIMYDN